MGPLCGRSELSLRLRQGPLSRRSIRLETVPRADTRLRVPQA